MGRRALGPWRGRSPEPQSCTEPAGGRGGFRWRGIRHIVPGRRHGRQVRLGPRAPRHAGGRYTGLVAFGGPGRALGAAGTGCRVPVAVPGDLRRAGNRGQPSPCQEPFRPDHPAIAQRGVLLVLRLYEQDVLRVRADVVHRGHRGVRHPGRGDVDPDDHRRGRHSAGLGGRG